ncbi:MAG TPA: type VII secretion-associated serine protease, partial [Micromonosporaceae bacterium]|nr:type VII secretion-associated serine protease [Micromonosporaceae bacterium]
MIRRATALICLLILMAGMPAHAADRVSDGQWFHTFLRTAEAHAITTGSGVTVAVIDTGVDASHPDLAGSVLPGADLVASGGDGRIDTDGHGTAMAGLIAAHGRVIGTAPQVKIFPVRYAATNEGGPLDDLAAGINWAARKGVDVISISHGDPIDDLLLKQVVQNALAADIVVVASAGNVPKVSRVVYPAAIPGVVAVGGVDRNGNHSSVSVTGPEVVISAPSDAISSTDKGGGYREGTGTSDATAIVAGAAALIRARFPQLKASEVVRRLTATAVDKGAPGRDNEYGYGVLNLV